MRQKIPNPVVAVVADVLGEHYYNHGKLNTLFMEAGAPGTPPEGNCVQKCLSWLNRVNTDTEVDPLEVLGGVLLQLMETGSGGVYCGEEQPQERQERIRNVLARFGLSYQNGGIILAGGDAPPVLDLNDKLRRGDFPALEIEFKRALSSLETDPPAAVTAACSILEALFKVILEEKGAVMPTKQTIKPLWSVVQDTLGLSPSTVVDDDIRRILSGLTSIVDGIGALRTHAGSAHGHGSQAHKLVPNQARLTVHAAHTLCIFVIETWEIYKKKHKTI